MKRSGVLVVVRGHVGDLVGATPALRDLRAANPDAHIAAFVNEYTRGTLEGCPYVDEVIYGFAYDERGRWQRLTSFVRAVAPLVGRFKTVVCLRAAPLLGPALALAIGARERVGFDQPSPWGRLLTHNAGPQPREMSNRTINALALEPLGIDTDLAFSPLDWVGDDVRRSTTALLREHGVDPLVQPFAVLQVSCDWGCNEMSSDKWAAVADDLVTRHGLAVVVVGVDNPAEHEKFAEISDAATQPIVSLQGATSIPQLFAVVAEASLVVATDSALTQIALAQAVPSVIMFGIEPVVENGPLPSEAGLMEVIQHWEGPGLAPTPNTHCRFGESFCHSEHCRENSSLAQTTVGEIRERVGAVLARHGSRSGQPD